MEDYTSNSQKQWISNVNHSHTLQKKLRTKQQRKNLSNTTQQTKKWITFTYNSPLIGKITSLFKQTNLNIALRTKNTIHQQLTEKPINKNPSGIYKLKCNNCNNAYIGQSDRSISLRHKEHARYIRNNNPI
jgi:hypothetical protein